MARRSLAAVKKSKPAPAGKSVQLISDLKYMGDEPNLKDQTLDEKMLARAFNWYNYMCTRKQARDYIEAYLKANKRISEVKLLQRVSDPWISPQAAWFARLAMRGTILNSFYKARFEQRLTEMFETAEAVLEEKESKKPEGTAVSIQDRIKDKVSDFIAEFEKAIDNEGWTLSMYQWMQSKNLPASLANKVAEFYKPISDEAQELIKKGCDAQLKEGYSTYTAEQLKMRAAFYKSIMDDCARYAQNTKTQRVVRKKKVVTPDKKLKNFKHQKESTEFKVVSIDPAKLLGAEELITFNTKYKLLTHFIAVDRTGLDVKGTTIINCDESKSKTYRLGRKTSENIEIALRGGKRAFAKMLIGLKTANLQLRINENTILLKV
jgi:hypothetical protein